MLSCFYFSGAQSVNDYKYVIVNNQYDFQNDANEFRLNELMVFELKKYGFNAYRNSERLPADLNRGSCNALQLKVDKSGMLWTDIEARLENCSGQVLFTTEVARARQKTFDKAYFSGVREAFKSFENLNYKYNGDSDEEEFPTQLLTIAQERELEKKNKVKESNVSKNIGVETDIDSTNEIIEESIEITTDDLKGSSNSLPESKTDIDFKDTSSTGYALKFDDSKDNFEIFKEEVLIGTGRKTAAGVYLITTDSFTGIGFVEGENFIIEYDVNGSTQRVVMTK